MFTKLLGFVALKHYFHNTRFVYKYVLFSIAFQTSLQIKSFFVFEMKLINMSRFIRVFKEF